MLPTVMGDGQLTVAPPAPTTKTPVDEFMLSEHQTIASAHFDLHSGLRQSSRCLTVHGMRHSLYGFSLIPQPYPGVKATQGGQDHR